MAILVEIVHLGHIVRAVVVVRIVFVRGIAVIVICCLRCSLKMFGERAIRFTDSLKFGSGTRIVRIFIGVRAKGFLKSEIRSVCRQMKLEKDLSLVYMHFSLLLVLIPK